MLKTILYASLILATVACAAEIEFSFDNQNNTGTFYEFDIMVNADVTVTRLGDALIYLNYSTAGFGPNVVASGHIEVTKAGVLNGELVPGLPLYEIVNITDNAEGCVAIVTGYLHDSAPSYGHALTIMHQPMLHIKLTIANTSANAGLSFNNPVLPTQPSMQSQQYQSENSTIYNPVVASATDNSSLDPISVNLVSFFVKSTEANVLLEWQTANEINHAGFNLFRSVMDENNHVKLNGALITNPSNNHMTGAEYSYLDTPSHDATYFYKLQSVDLDGVTTFFPSQKVEFSANTVADEPELPSEFKLEQNYPNPFNPETLIRYQLPIGAFVDIIIYNLQGQRVKQLVSSMRPAGHHSVLWNGLDEENQQVGSGTYILSMKAGEFQDIKRLTLLR